MKRLLILLVAAINLVFADALVKRIAEVRLKGWPSVAVVPGWFDLAYVENRGCAWGMLQGHVWPLAAFGVLALALIFWKRKSLFGDGWLAAVSECLLYAGIVGNLIDRVFRGYVIDMFDFHCGIHHFPCFNLADSFITVAVGLMLLSLHFDAGWKSKKKERG